jgi:CRISPR-associated protein Csm3
MNRTSLNFRGHVVIGGALECRTGLHIGGNRDSLVIGGLDLPVLRDSASRLPVISGSSLKGRLRGLLEMLRGAGPPSDGNAIDAIGLLFGRPTKDGPPGPTRLVVRDAFPLEDGMKAKKPDESTVNWWRMLETDGLGTEVKAETALNRITASAMPRQVERVLAGSRFGLEFVLNVFDGVEDEERLVKDLLVALALLEDSYLGGHGSRGYGRVAVSLHERPAVVTRKDYETGRKRPVPSGALKALDEIDADAWVASIRERLHGSE